jgi:glutamyl-tRNA synthetase
LKLLTEKLGALTGYTQENLEDAFKKVMDQTGLKLGKIAQPVRVALTGKTASPGIFEIISILGPERVIPRLEKAIRYIEGLEG